jgi:phytoene dehydrogenase-like protein
LEETTNGKACCKGVVLSDGKVIKAKKGVVCNAPLWNMARILSDSLPEEESSSSSSSVLHTAVSKVKKEAEEMEMTGSFMHLHLGIPKEGIPSDIEMHHSVLNFNEDITQEQNLVIISIPTVADPSLAPEGYHIVHAYTAASENFKDWEMFLEQNEDSGKVGASPNSRTARDYSTKEGYEQLKAAKAEALWKAVEFIIPDIRERATAEGSICIVGTPLTHRRYNQRFRGTYGPAPSHGNDVVSLDPCTQSLYVVVYLDE